MKDLGLPWAIFIAAIDLTRRLTIRPKPIAWPRIRLTGWSSLAKDWVEARTNRWIGRRSGPSFRLLIGLERKNRNSARFGRFMKRPNAISGNKGGGRSNAAELALAVPSFQAAEARNANEANINYSNYSIQYDFDVLRRGVGGG
jgi:hypothetical protein